MLNNISGGPLNILKLITPEPVNRGLHSMHQHVLLHLSREGREPLHILVLSIFTYF